VRRFEPIAGNLDGLLPAMFREAGFDHVAAAPRMGSPFGTLWITSGQKPA
jgi:hypothetical protein